MTLLSTVVLVRLVGGAEADDEDNRDANEVADGFCCCCCCCSGCCWWFWSDAVWLSCVQEEFGRATLLNILEAEDDEDNMVIEVGVAIAGERVVVGEDCGMFEDGGIKQDLGILILSDV